MFDFALSELLLVGVIALIVLGPERLPKAARMAGQLVGKMQRLVSSVKQELSAQVELEELRKVKEEFESASNQLKNQLKDTGDGIQSQLNDVSDGLKPWERLPQQRTPADFGLDEHGQPLTPVKPARFDENGQPIASIDRSEDDAVASQYEQEQAWQDYLATNSSSSTSQVNHINASLPLANRLHTVSLRKQAMQRTRDLRPKYRVKPQLRVHKKRVNGV